MKLTTIDLLTDTKFLKASKELQTSVECKFVLISNSSEYFLVFGTLHQYNYHANLVEKFCIDKKVSSKWKKHPDQFEISDNSVHIKGGGWFRIDFSSNLLSAMGISTAYGRFDEHIFEQFIEQNLVFEDFTVNIVR